MGPRLASQARCPRAISFVLVLTFSVLATACGVVENAAATVSGPTATAQAIQLERGWAALLQRPLHLPLLAPGAACPAAHGSSLVPGYGPAVGSNPVHAVGIDSRGVLGYGPPQPFGTATEAAWAAGKILWAIAPVYRGGILIRGSRIDGSGDVRFQGGVDQLNGGGNWDHLPLLPYLRLDNTVHVPDPTTVAARPTYARFQSPGCYALQVDGSTFTEVIVFTAEPQS
jgi:hypothetical protein